MTLHEYRSSRGLTLRELGKLWGYGASQLSQWERFGCRTVKSAERVEKLSKGQITVAEALLIAAA